MKARTLALIIIATICAFIIGAYVAPSYKEVALMHMRDDDYREALKLYTGLKEQGDESVGIVIPLVNLYVHYGDTDKAVTLLESFIAKHKRSVDGRRRLAELYKASQRLHDYCRVLEDLEVLSPSPDTLRKLADTYDFLGRYPKEREALERLIVSKGYSSREDDYFKLAVLDKVANRTEDAIKVIVAGIETKKYKVNIDTMHLATQLLLDKGESGKALTVASTYLTQAGSESDSVTLSSLFQIHDELDSAYKIIAPYLADVDKSLDLERQVVGLFLAQKKENEVFDLLSRQFTQNILPAPFYMTFIDLAIKRKDYNLVETIIKKVDPEIISEDTLLRYADFAFRSKYAPIAASIRNRLSKEYAQQAPLLSAVLDVAATNDKKAIEALLNLPDAVIVLPEEKLTVANIFIQYGFLDRACKLFENVPVKTILEALDPIQVASLYLDTNESAKGEQKLKEALPEKDAARDNSIQRTLFFLSIGQGKAEIVDSWIKDHPSADANILSDAYYLASRYHRNNLALEFARQIYGKTPSTENLLQLVEALSAEQHYAEAVRFLEKSNLPGTHARQALYTVIEEWITHENSNDRGYSSPDLDVFESMVPAELNRLKLSPEEKRNVSYLLENAGLKSMAEGYFVDLAANQPFGSHDVNELFGFWGNDLSPTAINWIVGRAHTSSVVEQAQWLSYLNDSNHSDIVVTFLQDDPNLSSTLADVYIRALVNTHNTEKLYPVLERAIVAEEDVDRLENFGKVADGEEITSLSEKAWRKVLSLDPDNIDADHRLGMLAFDKHKYAEAKKFLEQYLNSGEGDYQTNYAYGAILQKVNKKPEAMVYYKRALEQVSIVDNPSPDVLEVKAQLFHLNHQTDKALALFRELLAQDPENKNVRADLVEILIEKNQLDEAYTFLPQGLMPSLSKN